MTQITGTALIRQALRMKNRKINFGTMARDLGMVTSTLEDFAENRLQTLLPDSLQKITSYIWSNGTTLDIERDLLVPNSPPASPLRTALPPPAAGNPHYAAPRQATLTPAKQPAPKPAKRQGWLGGFF